VRDLDPVLLTSPAVRSGTTLLQRLLCSAGNALVYGEEVGKDLDLQLQVLAAREHVYRHHRQAFADRLAGVLAGDRDQWLVDLMPDIDGYLGALRQGALAGLSNCRDHAASVGRTVWGFKYPGWPPHLLQLLGQALPRTRTVYVVRDLGDTLRSAKTWLGLSSEAASEAFCAEWLAHVGFMRQWSSEHPVLWVRHEALLAAPEATAAELRAFLPLGALDTGVLARRINRSGDGAETWHGPRPYLEPTPLTAREQASVDAAMAASGLN
jgi:hypothetical protein